ncbi:MAG: hypothetical protein ACFFDN_02610 [Candidatus Hodarchaeota archaeon]
MEIGKFSKKEKQDHIYIQLIEKNPMQKKQEDDLISEELKMLGYPNLKDYKRGEIWE